MIRKIEPFYPDDELIRSNVEYIMECKPVKNLTEEEVLTTLRLLQLHVQLLDSYRHVCVYHNDQRLAGLDDSDLFLAMLIDCDQMNRLLNTRRCRGLFGRTAYHWRKIAGKCVITDTASALSEQGYPGFYGRGWVIADHIKTLIRWIVKKSDNEEIKKLELLY